MSAATSSAATSAGRRSSNGAMPTSRQARCLLSTYACEAGSGPIRIVASPGHQSPQPGRSRAAAIRRSRLPRNARANRLPSSISPTMARRYATPFSCVKQPPVREVRQFKISRAGTPFLRHSCFPSGIPTFPPDVPTFPSSFPLSPRHSCSPLVTPALPSSFPLPPRHSRESGNPEDGHLLAQYDEEKPSPGSSCMEFPLESQSPGASRFEVFEAKQCCGQGTLSLALSRRERGY